MFVKGDRVEASAGTCSPLEWAVGGGEGEGEILSVGASTWTSKVVLLRFNFDLSPFTCMNVYTVQLKSQTLCTDLTLIM